MACNISFGRNEACKDSISGIKAVYFINYTSGSFVLDADDVVTDFPLAPGLNPLTAYKFEVKGQNGFTTTVNTSRDNGTTFFGQEVTLTLKHLDSVMQKEFKLLAYGKPQIVVHTRQGDAFLVGKDEGSDLTSGTITSGIAYGDLSGYTMTFSAMEKLPPLFLEGATLEDPFSGIVNPPTVVV